MTVSPIEIGEAGLGSVNLDFFGHDDTALPRRSSLAYSGSMRTENM